MSSLQVGMRLEGFADDSFDEFYALLDKDYQPQSFSYFKPLTQSLFVAKMILTMLNCIPNKAMIPNIHNQLTAIGTNERNANSILPKEAQRKKNTMNPHAKPI